MPLQFFQRTNHLVQTDRVTLSKVTTQVGCGGILTYLIPGVSKFQQYLLPCLGLCSRPLPQTQPNRCRVITTISAVPPQVGSFSPNREISLERLCPIEIPSPSLQAEGQLILSLS